MNMLEFLNSLKAPILEMTGLPEDSVAVFAQQSVEEFVLSTVAMHQCAVLLGIPAGKTNPDARVASKQIDAMMEVEVWTPEVLVSGQTAGTLTICEWIMNGLHGYKAPSRPADNGGTRIPALRGFGLRTEQDKQSNRYLVGSLEFSVPLVPQPKPPAPSTP